MSVAVTKQLATTVAVTLKVVLQWRPAAAPASASSTPAETPARILEVRMRVLVVVSSGIHTRGIVRGRHWHTGVTPVPDPYVY